MARPSFDKRRVTTALARYGVNPLVKLAFRLRVIPPGYAILETTGRKSGSLRRTPVGYAREGNTVWLVSEHGGRAAYVRNLEAEPRVRLLFGGRWRRGRAVVVPEDDAAARLESIGTRLSRATVRMLGTEPVTVRVELEPGRMTPIADDLEERVRAALVAHPAVRSVELVGSRAHGRPTVLSDWDFLVATDDFAAVRDALPHLVAPLEPIVEQWDRLSEEAAYYMLLLPGGVKVDLVFDVPPVLEPPWEVRAETLPRLDAHFWDWILWLGGKQLGGNDELVRLTLDRLMYEHLLRPLGVALPPTTIGEAVERYLAARRERERELGVNVPRAAEEAVLPRLRDAGVVRGGGATSAEFRGA